MIENKRFSLLFICVSVFDGSWVSAVMVGEVRETIKL